MGILFLFTSIVYIVSTTIPTQLALGKTYFCQFRVLSLKNTRIAPPCQVNIGRTQQRPFYPSIFSKLPWLCFSYVYFLCLNRLLCWLCFVCVTDRLTVNRYSVNCHSCPYQTDDDGFSRLPMLSSCDNVGY